MGQSELGAGNRTVVPKSNAQFKQLSHLSSPLLLTVFLCFDHPL